MTETNKNISFCSTCLQNTIARYTVCWLRTNLPYLLPAASPAGEQGVFPLVSADSVTWKLKEDTFITLSSTPLSLPYLEGGSFGFTRVEVGCPFPDGSEEQNPIWLMQMPLFWLYPGGHPANPVVPNYLRGLWNTRWFYIPYVLENISMKMLWLNDVATSALNLLCFTA